MSDTAAAYPNGNAFPTIHVIRRASVQRNTLHPGHGSRKAVRLAGGYFAPVKLRSGSGRSQFSMQRRRDTLPTITFHTGEPLRLSTTIAKVPVAPVGRTTSAHRCLAIVRNLIAASLPLRK